MLIQIDSRQEPYLEAVDGEVFTIEQIESNPPRQSDIS
jgi:hypothetical protein